MPIDPATVQQMLDEAASAANVDAQGKAYEGVIAYLFEQVAGCIVERDITNPFETEQVDVAVGNSRLDDGLPLLPSVLLVECKDWAKPVDSKTVGYFINICANRRVKLGILVAANGITGDADDLSYAHSLGVAALPRNVAILVLTTADLQLLGGTDDFISLLNRRYLRVIASGSIGFPDP